jgi:hypothetical protein
MAIAAHRAESADPTWWDFTKAILSGLATGVAFGSLGGVVLAVLLIPTILLSTGNLPERFNKPKRAICDNAVHRAMMADTLLEFERARFVVEGMGCSRSRRIRDMHQGGR